ncbi:MAG: hypothetical protein KF745_09610 [Phycisphaeraceae bacterium]|nr:hypothetical protein [Phycisphaeraceae bacterium]
MAPSPESRSHDPRALRRAPATGDVVGKGCCGPARAGASARPVGGCCGKDLGPLDVDLEAPSEDDVARFSDVTRTCPHCRKEVYDDAEICYHCGESMSPAAARMPVWVIVAAVVAIAAFAFTMLR